MEPKYPKHIAIAHLPTPIVRLDRLSKYLGGPDIFIKRDDLTGLATGGNKTRKLEFLVAEALDKGCDHLITTGAPQSNHCRQTAAAAAQFGLGCSLILKGEKPEQITGNLLLDELLGAHIYWAEKAESSKHNRHMLCWWDHKLQQYTGELYESPDEVRSYRSFAATSLGFLKYFRDCVHNQVYLSDLEKLKSGAYMDLKGTRI